MNFPAHHTELTTINTFNNFVTEISCLSAPINYYTFDLYYFFSAKVAQVDYSLWIRISIIIIELSQIPNSGTLIDFLSLSEIWAWPTDWRHGRLVPLSDRIGRRATLRSQSNDPVVPWPVRAQHTSQITTGGRTQAATHSPVFGGLFVFIPNPPGGEWRQWGRMERRDGEQEGFELVQRHSWFYENIYKRIERGLPSSQSRRPEVPGHPAPPPADPSLPFPPWNAPST